MSALHRAGLRRAGISGLHFHSAPALAQQIDDLHAAVGRIIGVVGVGQLLRAEAF
jgi:hypothetical protein